MQEPYAKNSMRRISRKEKHAFTEMNAKKCMRRSVFTEMNAVDTCKILYKEWYLRSMHREAFTGINAKKCMQKIMQGMVPARRVYVCRK